MNTRPPGDQRSGGSGEVEGPTVSAAAATWRQSLEPALLEVDEGVDADDEPDEESDFVLDEADESLESDDDDEEDDEEDDDDEVSDEEFDVDFDLPAPRLSVL